MLYFKYVKFILFPLAAAALLSCFSLRMPVVLAKTESSGRPLKDGVYEGRSFKFPGQMIVSVTIKGGKITGIKIIRHPAPKKHNNLMQLLIEKIIEKQSTKVDAVTTATISSNALKKAVDNAIEKASAAGEKK